MTQQKHFASAKSPVKRLSESFSNALIEMMQKETIEMRLSAAC